MHVRLLRNDDLRNGLIECLGELAADTLTGDSTIVPVTRYARTHKKIRTYVAIEQGRVVGTASLFVEPKFLHGGSHVGHIEDVAVHPDWKGLGFGAAIMEHLIKVCKGEGCYKVILNCKEKVAPFYEKLGFRKHEVGMRLDLE